MDLIRRLALTTPIVQAPMAGVSTPAMAAAVCEAGGLGSVAVSAGGAQAAAQQISELRQRTSKPFNVNVFTHAPAEPDAGGEAAWLDALRPLFAEFDVEPPARLREIYRSFNVDDELLKVLLEAPPAVVSFHFGLPPANRIAALKATGCLLFCTATNLQEAVAIRQAGIDVIVAQGWEAGGHRGAFDPDTPDDRLGTLPLTRLLAVRSGLPVIAAGGIMDGAGVAAVLQLGAQAAQLGTAFIGCPESSASPAFREALFGPAAAHTVMTSAISGRPARCLANRFTAWGRDQLLSPPHYPIAYDAGKALDAAARTKGEGGYGAQWAGQGAPLSRSLPAAELMAELKRELAAAR